MPRLKSANERSVFPEFYSKLLAEETRSIHSLIFTLANEIDPRLNSVILTYYVDTICLEYHRFLTVEATCLRCVS